MLPLDDPLVQSVTTVRSTGPHRRCGGTASWLCTSVWRRRSTAWPAAWGRGPADALGPCSVTDALVAGRRSGRCVKGARQAPVRRACTVAV